VSDATRILREIKLLRLLKHPGGQGRGLQARCGCALLCGSQLCKSTRPRLRGEGVCWVFCCSAAHFSSRDQ